MFPAPSVQLNPWCPKWSTEVLQTVTTMNCRSARWDLCDKGKDKPFLPGSIQLALTIGRGFPLPIMLFAVARKAFPGPSCYPLQGQQPPAPVLSSSVLWTKLNHCCHGSQPGIARNILWADTSASKPAGNPEVYEAGALRTWSSQLALKVSTQQHLHRTHNNLLLAEGYLIPLPIPPKFTAELSPYLYRQDAVKHNSQPQYCCFGSHIQKLGYSRSKRQSLYFWCVFWAGEGEGLTVHSALSSFDDCTSTYTRCLGQFSLKFILLIYTLEDMRERGKNPPVPSPPIRRIS